LAEILAATLLRRSWILAVIRASVTAEMLAGRDLLAVIEVLLRVEATSSTEEPLDSLDVGLRGRGR